jgi:hypothetical protein
MTKIDIFCLYRGYISCLYQGRVLWSAPRSSSILSLLVTKHFIPVGVAAGLIIGLAQMNQFSRSQSWSLQ